jgi:hypothetical protein
LHKRKVEKDEESRQPKKGRLEAERRQIGLEKPLGQDNKGFALLQKMGFAPGLNYFCNITLILPCLLIFTLFF